MKLKKNKQNIYNTVRPVLKYNRDIVETEAKSIPLAHTHTHTNERTHTRTRASSFSGLSNF